MKKIELSDDFFPAPEQTDGTGHRVIRSVRDREAVKVILGKTPGKAAPRPPKVQSNGSTASSPFVLVATLPFVMARNMISLTASMFRAGLPSLSSRRR